MIDSAILILKYTRNVKQIFIRSLSSDHNSKIQHDYEYLQRSIVPTNHFQKSLPRLPIPKLEDTCRKYLKALQPILSTEEFIKTESIVLEFQNKDGIELNKELIAKNKKNKHTSYISKIWFDMYLKDRSPLVLNFNPFLQFKDDNRVPYMNQAIRATNMLVSSVRFMKSLKENILNPDVYHLNPDLSDNEKFTKFVRMLPTSLSWYGAYWYKAFPLDMSQYGNLFNSTRIPKEDKDELYSYPSAKHIVVIHKGHHFVFDVLDKEGKIQSVGTIYENIKYILNSEVPTSKEIGYFTTENRNVWSKYREKLLEEGNKENLDFIDSALFVLVLENEDSDDINNLAKIFLYGDASNRWFDKSLSLIINKSGRASVNFEHSWGDGVAVLRYFNDIYKDSINRPALHPDKSYNVHSSDLVKRIDWRTNDEIVDGIAVAKENYIKNTSNLNISYLQYTKFGKNYLKTKKISPDSFMQLSYQLAFYKMTNGLTVPTYESCSTAAFKHGRTETIRPANLATKRVCQLMCDKTHSSSNNQILEAIIKCSNLHNELVKDAAMGQGFDRHLLGLKHIGLNKGKIYDLFSCPSYSYINHNVLSTSSLSSPALQFGGFAPVVPDGYGIGQKLDGPANGPAPAPWNVRCYPTRMFHDELRFIEIPHTSCLTCCVCCSSIGWNKCHVCLGRGFMRCAACSGTGQFGRFDMHGHRHLDTCWHCHGTGRKKCSSCCGDGKLVCRSCEGCRRLKSFEKLHIQYKNIFSDHIISPKDFPESLIKDAQGYYFLDQIQPRLNPILEYPKEELCIMSQTFHQQHIIQSRNSRIIMQRQRIKMVPITECCYTWLETDGNFWVYGNEHKVYAPDYPQKHCWGCSIL